MPKSSNELKQERGLLIDKQGTLLELRKKEDREFTEPETKNFNEWDESIRSFDAQIKQRELEEAAAERAAATSGVPVGDGEQREEKKMLSNYDLHAAIRTQLKNGSMEGIEAEFHQELSQEAKRHGLQTQGILIPTAAKEKRDASQTVSADSGAYGGNLVHDNFGGIITELTPNPIIRQIGAQYFGNLTGNLVFTTDDGGIAATWEGETDTTSKTKTAYGTKQMSPKRLSATVGISLQNLLQSSIDLQGHTAGRIRRKNELALDTAAINGPGTGNVPMGILNASGTNAVVGGTNGAAPTWAHIIEMETKIGSANAIEDATKIAYLINYATKGFFKNTKHEAGDLGYLMDRMNEVNGYKVGVSNLVPGDLTKGTLSGTANAGIMGDFSNLMIGSWGFYDMIVDEITQKKSGIIEITTNQFVDMLLKQPAAFSVIKDWDLS